MEASVRSARWAIRAVPVVTVLVAASGCGFTNALAHPQAPDPRPIATATPAPPPEPPPVIVDGDLQTPGGRAVGHLVVTLGKARTGLQPPVSNSAACGFDANALQYLPVEFASDAPGLAAHVEVSTGPATPTDFGDVGIFVESNGGDQVYCTASPPLPTRDTFFNQAGARAITAWVVLARAVTPATPDGRPEVFPTLQLRISDLRELSDPTTVERRLVPGALGIGASCADDARAICVPLG
jgi:hypothetical protein